MALTDIQLKIIKIAEATVAEKARGKGPAETAEAIVGAVAEQTGQKPWKHAGVAIASALEAMGKTLPEEAQVTIAGAITAVTYLGPDEDEDDVTTFHDTGGKGLCEALARDINRLAADAGRAMEAWGKCVSGTSGGGSGIGIPSAVTASEGGGDGGSGGESGGTGTGCGGLWETYENIMHDRNLKIVAFQGLGCGT